MSKFVRKHLIAQSLVAAAMERVAQRLIEMPTEQFQSLLDQNANQTFCPEDFDLTLFCQPKE